MDSRFELKDSPRPLSVEPGAELPLVTIAWRVLRAQHLQNEARRSGQAEETHRLCQSLASIGEAVHRLRQEARSSAAVMDGPAKEYADRLLGIADEIEKTLQRAGVTVLAPVGQPYGATLMELLENVGQVPVPADAPPQVVEVIAPAILYHQDILRMGKAVIGVPGLAAGSPAKGKQADGADENGRVSGHNASRPESV